MKKMIESINHHWKNTYVSVEDKDGEWKCTSISYQDNKERKKWQFWKPKKVCSQAIMGKIK